MDKKNQLKKLNLQPLFSVRNTSSRILKILETSPDEAQKTGAVQAFEIFYELTWHALQKVLKWKVKKLTLLAILFVNLTWPA